MAHRPFLYDEVIMNAESRQKSLEAILELSRTVLFSSSLENLTAEAYAVLSALFPLKTLALYRRDRQSATMLGCAGTRVSEDTLAPFLHTPTQSTRITNVQVKALRLSREQAEQLAVAGINSTTIIPLMSGDSLLGTLVIGRSEEQPLPADEERLLIHLADQVALALRSASQSEALQKTRDEQQQLIGITNALVLDMEPSRLFSLLAEKLRALYPVKTFGIVYYNAARDVFDRGVVLTEQGTIQSVEPIPRQGTQFEVVVRDGNVAILNPGQIEFALSRFISLRDSGAAAATHAVLLPMFDRSKRILAIAAAAIGGENPPGQADIPFLNQIAAQVGLAIENMQAYRQIKQLRLRLEQEGKYLKEEINDSFNVSGLIYASPAVAAVMHAVEKAAATDATVLLLGETGTGKELFARTIHAQSRLADRALVKVNCGAIPAGLIESHLFGHEKGAFTGAVRQHIGVFEIADEGSIFLDEIAELPLDMQVKLLRVLQEGEITRVGGHEAIHVKVRVVAATNRNIEQMVEEGTFRADLYYRLAVIPIVIPPLRQRPEDIPLLATAFLNKYAERFRKPVKRITAEAMSRLRSYTFPGNVRELENLIERAVVLCEGSSIGPEFFHLPTRGAAAAQGSSHRDHEAGSEHDHLLSILKSCNWIIEGERGAARRLGIKPSTLRSRMARLGIKRQ